MDHLAASTAKLCQGGKNLYIDREGVPMNDSPVKGCEPVLTRLLKISSDDKAESFCCDWRYKHTMQTI